MLNKLPIFHPHRLLYQRCLTRSLRTGAAEARIQAAKISEEFLTALCQELGGCSISVNELGAKSSFAPLKEWVRIFHHNLSVAINDIFCGPFIAH